MLLETVKFTSDQPIVVKHKEEKTLMKYVCPKAVDNFMGITIMSKMYSCTVKYPMGGGGYIKHSWNNVHGDLTVTFPYLRH